MSWTQTVRVCSLCLWDHRECQARPLRVPWWAARAMKRAIREAL